MRDRRHFFKAVAGVAAGALAASQMPVIRAQGGRRQVSIGGRRIRVVDVHAHLDIPEVVGVVKGTPLEGQADEESGMDGRMTDLNQQGVDVQALSINGFWWYEADEKLAREICRVQNEGLAKLVSANPDRYVAMCSVALQFPELAAEQLEDGVKRLGMKGVTVGGHVRGEDISTEKYDPFWAKVAEMNQLVFMHPGGAENIIKENAFRGRGALGNIMGNPLETTYFLSRMIFDGTFDRHPNLKVCGAHAGGYLPSYFGRTDVACDVRGNANCANKRKPREYLRENIFIDTMVLSDNGLRHLVNEMGVSQIVYGTDNPFNWPVTVDLILEADYLNNAQKEAILGGNLSRLLGITS